MGISRFDFARTTTNIASASASSTAFIAATERNTCGGLFAHATTREAGGCSLAVALRAQCFLRHLPMRLPRPPLSMDRRVDDQDYDDSAQNNHPIGKFSARYRCLFAKPFHDRPPILKHRLTKGAKRDGKFEAEDCLCLSSFYRRRPHPPVCRSHFYPFISFGGDPPADNPATGKRNSMRTVFFNDGQLKITGVGRGRYRLPIHAKNYPLLADPRFDLDHSVNRGPSDIWRNAEIRREDYF